MKAPEGLTAAGEHAGVAIFVNLTTGEFSATLADDAGFLRDKSREGLVKKINATSRRAVRAGGAGLACIGVDVNEYGGCVNFVEGAFAGVHGSTGKVLIANKRGEKYEVDNRDWIVSGSHPDLPVLRAKAKAWADSHTATKRLKDDLNMQLKVMGKVVPDLSGRESRAQQALANEVAIVAFLEAAAK